MKSLNNKPNKRESIDSKHNESMVNDLESTSRSSLLGKLSSKINRN